MNLFSDIQLAFGKFLQQHFGIDATHAHENNFHLNVDINKQEFGDLNSNAAMVLAKQLKKNPKEIASQITTNFSHPAVEKMEIAGAGFINAFLHKKAFEQIAKELFEQKENYFKPDTLETNYNFNIEYVSANPTGPLHLGHGRGAIIGDVLSSILQFLGYQVTREFYINDAGNQIAKLGASFKVRVQQQLGIDAAMTEDGYQGDYLIELAAQLIKEKGKTVVNEPDDFFSDYAKAKLLEIIKQTLADYGVQFDVWFSEKTLHESGQIDLAIKLLQKRGFIYEQENALWLKSTAYGDDKDRVVRKSTGEWTYVAADIAYLLNKVERGFNQLIMVLGHDHHSYAVRLQAIMQAFGFTDTVTLTVILYQLVTMKASGQLVQMSKRAGTMISLADIIQTVGKDVARFFYLHRKADAQLEFDLDLALKKTEENPVFYIQYAYVRTGSILHRAEQENALQNITINDAVHLSKYEHLILKKIAFLKNILLIIANTHQTHHLSYYVIELADIFHRYYAQHRIVDADSILLSRARLLVLQLIRQTLALSFDLLKISKHERM